MIKSFNPQKKSNASLAGTMLIFLIAFLVFCICAIDVGYTVTSRFKAQKTTETIALYAVSYINSLPEDKRTKENLAFIKESFENLYSNYALNGNYKFEITETDIKTNSASSKIKITTQTSIPTLFLRYTGIGIIKIIQTAYASSAPFELTKIDTDDYLKENTFTFRADEIITDKSGADIEIEYNRPYLAFAGLKKGNAPENDNIYWVEIGSMSDDDDKTSFTISNTDETYDAKCISKETAKYDFSADENKTLGLVQYVKIIKTDACNTDYAEPETPEIPPVVTALNSAKIISRQTFLKD